MSGLKCETLLKTDEGTSIEDDKSSKMLLNGVHEHQGTLTTCKTINCKQRLYYNNPLYYSIYKSDI